MIPENTFVILIFLFGILLLVLGTRMIIRRQVTVTFMQSKEIGNRNLNLKLTECPALLYGAGILVLGIRVCAAYVMTWMEGGDLNEIWVGGSITIWAFATLIIAIIWQLLVKARSVYENPEIKKKISDKIQQAIDEKENR